MSVIQNLSQMILTIKNMFKQKFMIIHSNCGTTQKLYCIVLPFKQYLNTVSDMKVLSQSKFYFSLISNQYI